MILEKIAILKFLQTTASSLLSLTAVAAPTSVVLAQKNAASEINEKRTFNPDEENDLDYTVESHVNPFTLYSAQRSEYTIDPYFYSKQNHASHTNYKSLEWKDLSSTSTYEMDAWLSNLTKYLVDDKNHWVQITPSMSSSIEDNYNYDFSAEQNSTLSLDWSTSQFGFQCQSFEDQFAFYESKANCYFPQIVFKDPTSPTKQVVWKSLTGSDFYTNYSSESDPVETHYPHPFNFYLEGKVTNKNYPQRQATQEIPQTTITGEKLFFEFTSEEDTPYLTSNDTSDTTWESLSDLLKIQATAPEAGQKYIILPYSPDDFRFFAFDSGVKRSSSPKNDYLTMFNTLYPEHGFDSDSELFSSIGLEDSFPLINQVPIGTNEPYSLFIPSLVSNEKNRNDSKLMELPDPITVDIPTKGSQEGFVNFSDYYNLNDQTGVSCDVDIDRNGTMTYTFKSGNVVVDKKIQVLSYNFREFLNMCLSSMASTSEFAKNDAGKVIENPIKNFAPSSYSSIRSSGDNNIINFHTTVTGSGSGSSLVPFAQDIFSNEKPNEFTAHSAGFGMSVSNDKMEFINAEDNLQTTSSYMTNFAFLSNQAKLTATNKGSNNRMLCNLDYLLAIDPSSTEFYNNDNSDDLLVRVKLNPYYLQAAANAYSSYNFWLDFASKHDFTEFITDRNIMLQAFRDLIMRGFIKTKAQAEALYTNLQNKDLGKLLPSKWTNKYSTQPKSPVLLSSYSKLNSDYTIAPCDDFIWSYPSFQAQTLNIWPDEEGNITEKRPTVSQASWAPFCWKYSISPSTFSFLKSIPLQYKIEIPWSIIDPSSAFNSGSVSGALTMEPVSLTWEEILRGKSFDFKYEKPSDWNNISFIIGSNSSSTEKNQGIHGISSNTTKLVPYLNDSTITLSCPDFSNIKLATISNNNHINASGEGFDFNPIQAYTKKAARDCYIKDNNTINYLFPDTTHNAIALQKNDIIVNPTEHNYLSNNTYVVTKVNAKKAEWDKLKDNYIQIDSSGNYGVVLNFSNWRDTLSSVYYDSLKYYSSTNAKITGINDKKDWLMSGVAPEDWFDSKYLVEFNGYKTYQWAFHPTGLWGYNMQFCQDLDMADDGTWDQKHQEYGLDYSLWGQPIIEPIYKSTYVPKEIKTEWQQRWEKEGYSKSGLFYTNNSTHELAFRVLYPSLAFKSESFFNKTITPVQYVYFHDCFYNVQFNANSQQHESIEQFVKTNKQFGDYTPTNFDYWNIDITAESQIQAKYSISQITNLLDLDEIIGFLKTTSTSWRYKTNITLKDFKKFMDNGWIYVEPKSFDNKNHSLSFVIHYRTDLQYQDDCPKLEELNPNFEEITWPNGQVIKIPVLDGKWSSTSVISIKDFRCVGTEWENTSGSDTYSSILIGLIICCSVTPVVIAGIGFGLYRARTKYKRIK